MDYQTFPPHPELAALIKCYWTLEIPATNAAETQRIVPDGCIEMVFLLGDAIKHITTGDDFILQPRAFVLGQITEPFYIQPTGYVKSFSIRFYPHGFANFVKPSIDTLTNKETPLEHLFEKQDTDELTRKIVASTSTQQSIGIVEDFLVQRVNNAETVNRIVKSTVDALFSTRGSTAINSILKDQPDKRRLLERKFLKQVGISPKQLSKIIRLQSALKLLLDKQAQSLTRIAYESEYYDQAHFIKDFREFTGITPKEFSGDERMLLSSLFYRND